MATVRIPPVLRASTGGAKEVEASGDNIGDSLPNGGHDCLRTGAVWLARPRSRRMAGGHDRQRAGECLEGVFGTNIGEFDVQSESLRPMIEEITVAEQIGFQALGTAADDQANDDGGRQVRDQHDGINPAQLHKHE